MPIHVKIVSETFKQLVKFGSRYYRLEGKAFQKLYQGFPQSRTIGRGVRHGLTAGSIVGSLINDAEDSPGNGFQKPFSKRQPITPSKPYQTRRGFTRRSRSRCPSPERSYYR